MIQMIPDTATFTTTFKLIDLVNKTDFGNKLKQTFRSSKETKQCNDKTL